MLAIFVFAFVLLLCFCIVLRPLLLSIYVYALLLVLVLVLWGFIGSPLRVFLAYRILFPNTLYTVYICTYLLFCAQCGTMAYFLYLLINHFFIFTSV